MKIDAGLFEYNDRKVTSEIRSGGGGYGSWHHANVYTCTCITVSCGASMTEIKEVSVLIGGRAGDGINSAGALVAQLLNHLGYRIYLYFDYPSLIRGGHNFAIIRGSEHEVGTCR